MPDFSSRSSEAEMMDDFSLGHEIIDPIMDELEVVNKLLGGYHVFFDAFQKIRIKDGMCISDWGCGGGDSLRAIAKWARKRKLKIRLIGVDATATAVAYAREKSKHYPEITYIHADVMSDELYPESFDIVISSLFTHHFADESWIKLIQKMAGCARTYVVINDLHRHWFAYHFIGILTSFFSGSEMVKHDSKLSVLRSFKRKELDQMLKKGGFDHYTIKWMWAFRWQVIIATGKMENSVSNEVLPFLESLNIRVSELGPSEINRLSVTSVSGNTLHADLPMGGFGLSRYQFDNFLFQHAKKLGVKYHIKTDLPNDLIRLDNFQGGYSGVCKIEEDKYSLCYLSETASLKKYTGIREMEEQVLFKNPYLKALFNNSEFLFENPEVINEISFERKTLTENHLLFCGDSAGMITPLCGNGMAIAIHSGKILAESIIRYGKKDHPIDRPALEKDYKQHWEKQFALRLKSGRLIQKLFGHTLISDLSVSALNKFPSLTQSLVKKTHGKVFI